MGKLLLILTFLIVLVGCQNSDCEEYPEIESAAVQVNRLELDFHKLKSKEDIKRYLDSHLELKDGFLLGPQYPDSFIVDYLYRVNTVPASDTIFQECNATFGDFSKWTDQFSQAFSLLKYYFPEEQIRTVNTFIPGLTRDLFVNDSSVYIGIDYFLGPNATFRPQNYQYILKRYIPESVAPMTILYISGKYNQSDLSDKSLLSEMIYFGKSYYFTKKMLPCIQDSLIIGYSSEEIEGSEKHIKTIWAHFIENELMYITNNRDKQRYVGERPQVTEIGDKCPGRIGQFLGWKIVQEFMNNNPDVTLADLMAEKNAKKILEMSKFKP